MVNLGDVGRICLNQERRGVCEHCLWWEWDSRQQRCSNVVLSRLPVVPGAALRRHRRRRGAPEPLAQGLGSQAPAQEVRLSYRQGEPVAGDATQGDLQTFRQGDAVPGGN